MFEAFSSLSMQIRAFGNDDIQIQEYSLTEKRKFMFARCLLDAPYH